MQETQEVDAPEIEESDEVEITTPAEVEDDEHQVLHQQAREQKRLSNKPYIDHLEDAITIENGVPFFNRKPGDTVIIERFASVLASKPWLDTRAYKVINIDAATGDLKLQDADCGQQSSSNYLTGPKLGYRFKIPEKKGAALPRKNKAAPKVSVAEKEKVKAEKPAKSYRIYSTKGVIHTRFKGVVFVPVGPTKAVDAQRCNVKPIGTNKLMLQEIETGWEETWVINKDMK